MPWTVYTINAKPTALRNPESFPPDTVKRVVDPVTRQQLPVEGAVVRIKSREIERYWDRTERAGDVDITAAEEPTPWAMAFAAHYERAAARAAARAAVQRTADHATDE